MTYKDFLSGLQPLYWHPPASAILPNDTGLGKVANKSPAAFNLVFPHYSLQSVEGQRNAVSAFSTLRLALEASNLDADVITQGAKAWPTYWASVKKNVPPEHRSVIDKFTHAAISYNR